MPLATSNPRKVNKEKEAEKWAEGGSDVDGPKIELWGPQKLAEDGGHVDGPKADL